MALAKDKGAIKKWAGGSIWYQACGDDGTPTSSNAWAEMGYIQESKLSDITEQESITDETGEAIASLDGTRSVKFTGMFMQSEKDRIDFLKDTVRGKFYNIYHSQGVVNGKTQEMLYGICVIKPQVELASGTKRIPFEFTVLKNDAAISGLVTTGITTKAFTSPQTISAGSYYSVIET